MSAVETKTADVTASKQRQFIGELAPCTARYKRGTELIERISDAGDRKIHIPRCHNYGPVVVEYHPDHLILLAVSRRRQ